MCNYIYIMCINFFYIKYENHTYIRKYILKFGYDNIKCIFKA